MDNIEWFCGQLAVKSQQYAIGSGGVPDADWRDKCGAFAALKSDHLKRLADMLVSPDCKQYQDAVEFKLQRFALDQMAVDGVELRCVTEQSIEALALKMAKLARWLYQYDPLDRHFRRAGKLWFAGIAMGESTYKATWLKYEQNMVQNLIDWTAEIDSIIGDYRRGMRAA